MVRATITWLFIFFSWVAISIETQFRLYHTKYPVNHGDHTCLYRYTNEFNGRARHLVSYCIRASTDVQLNSELPCYGDNYTFAELKRNNFTSEHLMKWFAPIDLISDYQRFLVDNSNENELFCNCSETDNSFGTRCQYQFFTKTFSFERLVDAIFDSKKMQRDIRNLTDEKDITCYALFNCTTYTNFCLDWRQVCDSRHDCLNGLDEERCLEKEINECDETAEYRCRSGHCIPQLFSFDLTPDCPNWDDEQRLFDPISEGDTCAHSSLVDCEEHSCGISDFSCGDGNCFRLMSFLQISDECESQRDLLLLKKIYQPRTGLYDNCWLHMICNIGLSCIYEVPTMSNSSCQYDSYGTARFCFELRNNCTSLIEENYIFFPETSIVYPFLRLLYKWRPFQSYSNRQQYPLGPEMICYNKSVYEIEFPKPISINGYQCHFRRTLFPYKWLEESNRNNHAVLFLMAIQKIFSPFQSLSNTQLYRCTSGHYISRHRLQDGYFDCFPFITDENLGNLSCSFSSKNRFKCAFEHEAQSRCIPRRHLRDNTNECDGYSDELFPIRCTNEYDCQFFRDFDLQKTFPIMYEEFCNGVEIDWGLGIIGDEINCDTWPCRARAHYCDDIWNRRNGCDEVNCPHLISGHLARVANCSLNEHYCLHLSRSRIRCLPLEQAGDGHINCLFAFDEQMTPERKFHSYLFENGYFQTRTYGPCWNSSVPIASQALCDRTVHCPLQDDEILCSWHFNSRCSSQEFTCKNGTCVSKAKRCDKQIDCWPAAEDEWGCHMQNIRFVGKYRPFTLRGFHVEPYEKEQVPSILAVENQHVQLKQENIVIDDPYVTFHCHRGILLHSKTGNDHCLCPPSYHGHRCQFQSERLFIIYRTELPSMFNQNTIYHLVFFLLDQNDKVLSLETVIHMPIKQSTHKHLIYLIYPRDTNRSLHAELSVHIEAYSITSNEIQALSFAWHYNVQFPFLPVNRLALKLYFEQIPLNMTLCHHLGCVHGLCTSYVNNRNIHFCSCYQGWIGPQCNKSLTIDLCKPLNCDPHYSKCLVHDNRALCLCTLGRIGHNCRVPYDACDGIHCLNDGHCVSLDERTLKRVCICSSEYFSDYCQYRVAHLTIQIPRTAQYIPVMITHFLHTPNNIPGILSHRSTFFMKNIHPGSQMIILDHQQQFLSPVILLQTFVDLASNYGSYYLLALLDHNRTSLTKMLTFDNRCIHVSERLNKTIMNFTWIERVKLYHHYFKDIRCFYDEIYMCLVDDYQLIDCLFFNHDVAHCTDRNYCENGGRCLEDKKIGQVQFACVCPECHYGLFCQLTMTKYSLTLDSMLGQEIITDASLDQQKPFIKITLALVVLMSVIGFTLNLCSTWTFSHDDLRKTGCGFYLLILSIANQISLILVVGRFIYLLVSQIMIVSNSRFLSISCMFFDFLIQLSTSFCDWLTACIACERTVSAVKGVHFDKILSIRVVKFVIPMLLGSLTVTSIHQMFIRELILDPRSDQRVWCIVKYPQAWVQTYDIVINLFNTIVPFLFNLCSAVLLLIIFSRTKQKTLKKSYIGILKKNVKTHKDLIISPLLMISFKLPMLIVVFILKCIKAKWELYLSITCYFMALVPLLATFAIFILPSPSYFKIFNKKRTGMFKRLWRS